MNPHNSSLRFAIGTLLAMVVTAGPNAWAERHNPLEGQPAVRRRVDMREGRFDLTAQLMTSMNQDYRTFIGGSIVAQYHILDWLGINLQFGFGGGLDTPLASKIYNTLPTSESGAQPSQQQFKDHLASISYLFSGALSVTPIAGKMSFFGVGFLRYDAYGLFGVGGINLTNTFSTNHVGEATCTASDANQCNPENSGIHVAGMFGIGGHFFFNDWVGLNIEMRDYLASTNPTGLDTNHDGKVSSADNRITNNLFFVVGATFLLPPTAGITK